MRISVPPRYRPMFWAWGPRPGRMYWFFRSRPAITPGDSLTFTQDRRPVATAEVTAIQVRGGRWEVRWHKFEDLREEGEEGGFEPSLYGGYGGARP